MEKKTTKITNKKKSEILQQDYATWKKDKLTTEGYFPIFSNFKESFLLSNLSGNALRLYIYLGLHAKNNTGECWMTIDTMAKYFNKSTRTISGWIKELENAKLIKRMQMEQNGVAFTFLRPY